MARVDSPRPTESDLSIPAVVATLRVVARSAGIAPILVGVLVLVGWSRDVELFKRIVPDGVAMNPASAVGFILLGLSLSLVTWASPSPVGRRLAMTAGIAASALGLSRL